MLKDFATITIAKHICTEVLQQQQLVSMCEQASHEEWEPCQQPKSFLFLQGVRLSASKGDVNW